MNEQINRLAVELILELSKSTPEEYLQFKLMMLAYPKATDVMVLKHFEMMNR